MVIDGEAGVEQINRRVMEKVTHLLLVSAPSKKGTNVIRTIKKVADELVMYQKLGAVINRCNDPALKAYIDTGDIPVLAYIPDDTNLARFDVQSRSILELPAHSSVAVGGRQTLPALGIE